MNGYKSLSYKERTQQFYYLLLLTLLALFILSLILLSRFSNPFNNEIAFEMQLLEQQKKFLKQQKTVNPFLEKTFAKIDQVPLRSMQAFVENDIKNSISDITNTSNDESINDPRKEGFQQIASFYKMYFEDKKIAGKKVENIELFEKQFSECSIGFKEKEQQLAQKNAAISARSK